jgi:hypothetical protein
VVLVDPPLVEVRSADQKPPGSRKRGHERALVAPLMRIGQG